MFSKNTVLTVLFFFTGAIGLLAQETVWDIPKEAEQNTAPFLFNDSTRKAGEAVFMANCKSCHGDPGKANFANLSPQPKDPASAEYQKHSDGAMFYIVSTGKGLMPSFQNTLNDNQRWSVISFVRSFNKNYIQPAIKEEKLAEVAGTIKMSLSFDEKSKSIIALIQDKADGKNVPVANVPVKLFVKRTFGNLPVGQSNSNTNGKAIIPFPSDLPCDTAGNLNLVAIAGAGGKQILVEKTEPIGLAVNHPKLLDQRAMWNIGPKSPIWLIISYFSGLIAIICVVLYVFLHLKKIKDINKENQTNHE